MNHREASKKVWTSSDPARMDEINLGSMQRIADACELMAQNHVRLVSDRDMYERWYRQNQAYYYAEQRRTRALRGVITKLKAKAK